MLILSTPLLFNSLFKFSLTGLSTGIFVTCIGCCICCLFCNWVFISLNLVNNSSAFSINLIYPSISDKLLIGDTGVVCIFETGLKPIKLGVLLITLTITNHPCYHNSSR